jgi:Yippee zinc-binding/DNA-binding /Mis18, centromere assembly
MGKGYYAYLDSKKIYVCNYCKVHLSSRAGLESKDFWAGDGRAFLYNIAINIYLGELESRMLRTGMHSVRDIFCKSCNHKLGWKYEWASEPEQKYKEGKFILERNHIEKIEWSD